MRVSEGNESLLSNCRAGAFYLNLHPNIVQSNIKLILTTYLKAILFYKGTINQMKPQQKHTICCAKTQKLLK